MCVNQFFAVKFECEFIWYDTGCKVTTGLINRRNDAIVTNTSGAQIWMKNKEAVKSFDARSVLIRYFPQNLHHFFPNLIEFFIEHGLREIHKEDLQPYPKLIKLYLSYNELEVLEENLFQYNLELKLVFLDGNRIRYVHPNIFDHLSNLNYLGFHDNDCYSGHVEDSSTEALTLAREIKSSCSIKSAQTLTYDELLQENAQLIREKLELLKEYQDLLKKLRK